MADLHARLLAAVNESEFSVAYVGHRPIVAALRAVVELADEWSKLASAYDRGDTPHDTAKADIGRYLIGVIAVQLGIKNEKLNERESPTDG